MNKDNILKVADLIEKQTLPGVRFDICTYGDPDIQTGEDGHVHLCGAACCIAGTAVVALTEITAEKLQDGGAATWDRFNKRIPDVAAELPGLDDFQAIHLFMPVREDIPGLSYSEITPTAAAKVLRNLAETGRVDWSVAYPKEEGA